MKEDALTNTTDSQEVNPTDNSIKQTDRGIIRGDKKAFLKVLLEIYQKGDILHNYGRGIAGLARYIADNYPLFHERNGEWKPLKTNSIETILRNIKKDQKDNLT